MQRFNECYGRQRQTPSTALEGKSTTHSRTTRPTNNFRQPTPPQRPTVLLCVSGGSVANPSQLSRTRCAHVAPKRFVRSKYTQPVFLDHIAVQPSLRYNLHLQPLGLRRSRAAPPSHSHLYPTRVPPPPLASTTPHPPPSAPLPTPAPSPHNLFFHPPGGCRVPGVGRWFTCRRCLQGVQPLGRQGFMRPRWKHMHADMVAAHACRHGGKTWLVICSRVVAQHTCM